MGRLDDIVKRNKQAIAGDGLIVGAVSKLKEAAPEPQDGYSLPSQRKSGTAVWKVLVVMAVLGAAIGYYACATAKDDQRYDRDHR